MIALIRSIGGIWSITALITHLWTTVIAFSESGFFAGILTLVVPFLSELYWIAQMWGENEVYVTVALIHLILGLLISFFSDSE